MTRPYVPYQERHGSILHPVCQLIDALWREQEADLQRRHDEHQSAIERAQQRWGM